MVTSRTYHALHLDIASHSSDRICYVILPEKFNEGNHFGPLLERIEKAIKGIYTESI